MRLVAIYIQQHNYLFDKPQMINLGGKYFYEFEPNEQGKLVVKRVENIKFVKKFWGDNISLVSAIVGENGVGKTSILKELVMSFDRFREGTSFNNTAFVYEIKNNDFIIDTKLDLVDEKLKGNFSKVRIEYYNPVLDYDLQDISGYINPSNIFKNTLEDYHLTILEYQTLFNYSDVSNHLKQLYQNDFPKFGSILLKGKLHYKDDFRKIFALSNLQEGMDKYLEEVFKKYPNFDKDNNQFVHNQNNFIQNVESTILAILVINNTYSARRGTGISQYSIQSILEGDNFLNILERFKKQYISLNSTIEILKKYENKDIEEFKDYLIKEIHGDPISNDLLRILLMFEAFEDFYNELLEIQNKQGFSSFSSNVFFSNSNNEKELNDNMIYFINLYRNLLTQLNVLHVKNPSLIEFSFFDPSSNMRYNLSNGEKALLNLYSIIYNFTLNSQIKTHNWKNFIFLLDEADLGFHPDWKKRFINSITKVFPEILKEIYYLESIQIIFTTHDPLTLSDIPNSNVVYLKKENGGRNILENIEKPIKSFGANITDLLSDSFFINNGLMGDFAKEKINEVIELLNNQGEVSKSTKRYIKKVINIIDEPLISAKLKEKFYRKFPEEFDNEKEIRILNEQAKKLGFELKKM